MMERREEARQRVKQRRQCIETANYVVVKTIDVETKDDDKDVNNNRVAGGGAAA
jgi:hypothetical protein